jgi:hypothetical protein
VRSEFQEAILLTQNTDLISLNARSSMGLIEELAAG